MGVLVVVSESSERGHGDSVLELHVSDLEGSEEGVGGDGHC